MKRSLLTGTLTALALCASAQSTEKPLYWPCQYDDGAIINNMSDNGKWAAISAGRNDGTGISSGARLLNIENGATTELIGGLDLDKVISYSVNDVSNDGVIAVGELDLQAAYYNTKSRTWKTLQIQTAAERDPSVKPEDNITLCQGKVNAVSADSRYGVGMVSNNFDTDPVYYEYASLWDLETNQEIPTPGLPTKDMSHMDQHMNRFVSISSDNNKLLGVMSFSYIPCGDDAGGRFYYVYDRQKGDYKVIGFTESDTEPWTPDVPNILFIDVAYMSNNGKYVTGVAHMFEEGETYWDCIEYDLPYLYEVDTDKFTLLEGHSYQDRGGWAVDNEGNIYGAETMSPMRDFRLLNNGYWVSFDAALKQFYDINLKEDLGLDCAGTPIGISDDGRTIASSTSPFDGYVIRTPEAFNKLAPKTDLLYSYTVWPTPGITISELKRVELEFEYNVSIIGGQNSVKLVNAITDEVVETSATIENEWGKVVVSFNQGVLDEVPYRVVIPAKTFALTSSPERGNNEIVLTYVGRENGPVKPLTISPKNNAAVGKIDMMTNPIIIDFDADVQNDPENPMGYLYRGDSTEPLSEMFFDVQGSRVLTFPAEKQYLYKDETYRVEIPAGAFCDMVGNEQSKSEAIVLNYKGAYEREISYDKSVLYENDFSAGVDGLMLLDNDMNNYSEESRAHGFGELEYLDYPWMPVMESYENPDMALATTSMYDPAGQADDWWVLPKVYIMDKLCNLQFQSQSYKKNKQDRLKVYAWEHDKELYYIDSEIAERIRTEGTLIYDELQDPGAEEEALAGEWKDNKISLEAFEGKNIYLAFVNDNYDQSEVYIDNVKVLHELPYFAQVTSDEIVVDKNEMTLEGLIEVRDENKTYCEVIVRLLDATGERVATYHEYDTQYRKGDKISFKFDKPLPLTVGAENGYKLMFSLVYDYFDQLSDENEMTGTVKSLAFKPEGRVILEEFTGVDCPNCPLGIQVINKLSATYSNKFIPMALHAYDGDPYMMGSLEYAGSLGFFAAPSGIVQRKGDPIFPMASNENGEYFINAPEGEAPLWADAVRQAIAEPVEADLSATYTLNEATQSFSVPVKVNYALTQQDLNLKLFAVVLENGLKHYQLNGFFETSDRNLGEFGKGGQYAQQRIENFEHNHVVRGTFGNNFYGTPDLLPTEMKANDAKTVTLKIPVPTEVENVNQAEIVVVLFDGITDKVINATVATPADETGIAGVEPDELGGVKVVGMHNKVQVVAPTQAWVEVYSVNGMLLAKGEGENLSLAVPAYQGVVLVRVSTAEGTVVKKVIL